MNGLIEDLRRIGARAASATCENTDIAIGADCNSIAEDMGRYECNEKLGEHWVTGKKPPHPRFVINAKHQIVYGHPKFLKAIGEKIRNGESTEFEGKNLTLRPGILGGKFDELRPEGTWPSEESDGYRKSLPIYQNYPQYLAQSSAYDRYLESRLYDLKRMPHDSAVKAAGDAIKAVTSYLYNHGSYGFNDGHIKEMQRTFGEITPELKKTNPEFFRDDFYVRMLDKHTNMVQSRRLAG